MIDTERSLGDRLNLVTLAQFGSQITSNITRGVHAKWFAM